MASPFLLRLLCRPPSLSTTSRSLVLPPFALVLHGEEGRGRGGGDAVGVSVSGRDEDDVSSSDFRREKKKRLASFLSLSVGVQRTLSSTTATRSTLTGQESRAGGIGNIFSDEERGPQLTEQASYKREKTWIRHVGRALRRKRMGSVLDSASVDMLLEELRDQEWRTREHYLLLTRASHAAEALRILLAMRAVGVDPEEQNYHSVIAAQGKLWNVDISKILKMMARDKVGINRSEVYHILAASCADAGDVYGTDRVVRLMRTHEIAPSAELQGKIMRMYGKLGRVDVVEQLFKRADRRKVMEEGKHRDEMKQHLIAAYIDAGLVEAAEDAYVRQYPNDICSVALSHIVRGYANRGDLRSALKGTTTIFKSRAGNLTPCALFAVSKALASQGKPDRIRGLMKKWEQQQQQPASKYATSQKVGNEIWSLVIHAHSNTKRPHDVLKVLDEMRSESREPEVEVYSAALNVLGKAGHLEEARSLLEDMHRADVEADEFILTSLIFWYLKAGKIVQAQEIFGMMAKMELVPDRAVLSSLVELYGREQSLSKTLALWELISPFLPSVFQEPLVVDLRGLSEWSMRLSLLSALRTIRSKVVDAKPEDIPQELMIRISSRGTESAGMQKARGAVMALLNNIGLPFVWKQRGEENAGTICVSRRSLLKFYSIGMLEALRLGGWAPMLLPEIYWTVRSSSKPSSKTNRKSKAKGDIDPTDIMNKRLSRDPDEIEYERNSPT